MTVRMMTWMKPVALAVVLLAGVTAANAEPLKIAYSDWPGWVAWDIAKEKGFFEKHGVEVELLWFDYVASMDAFAAGKADAVRAAVRGGLVTGLVIDRSLATLLLAR